MKREKTQKIYFKHITVKVPKGYKFYYPAWTDKEVYITFKKK